MAQHRAAIIGCGLIAGGYDDTPEDGLVRTHALAYQQNKDTSLVALVDQDTEKMRRFAERWDAGAQYDNMEKMLAEQRPSIVSICTPDDRHADALEACLHSDSVQGVWCEKPLTTNLGQARTLIKAYEASSKTLLVNYPRPYAPKLVALKAQLQAGDFGAVQKVVASYTKGIMHNGSHALDLLIDWFGAPISSQVFGAMIDFTEDDPTVDALVNLQGAPVYMMGLSEACYSQFEIDIYCAAARVTLTHHGRYIQVRRLQPDAGPGGNRYLDEDVSIEETETGRAMGGVLDALIASLDAASPLQQGDHILCVMDACDQLAKSGRKLLQD